MRGREVAITIDDLPRGGDIASDTASILIMTKKLLEPFRMQHIPVTGFVNECRHPDGLAEVLAMWTAAGADLGNHTCTHLDLHARPVSEFEADIIKGETVTTSVLGHRPLYFRYPYLHVGQDTATKSAIADFLKERGYRMAPVTLDDSDYMFAAVYARALARGDRETAARVVKDYVPYMESIFDFFEKRSAVVTGHEIRQILLIHASQLNADQMPALLAMMKRRGYTFISLTRALEDEAYRLPESYTGRGGFSWIHRWSITKGMKPDGEPDEPQWIRDALKAN
jgi:peptidoglycan-N-acetylglucosamine deacetylase